MPTASSAAFPLNHAHLLLRRLLKLNPQASSVPALHYIYLAGETVQSRHDTDRELPFRQESNFAWLSGACDVPGSALTIKYEHQGGGIELDEDKVETKLHLPAINPDEVMWCGLPPSPADLSTSLHFTSIEQGWTPISLFPPQSPLKTFIHHLPWTRPPTSLVSRINGPTATSEFLIKALHEARRNKTPQEIEWMRKASEITAGAHLALMKGIGSGEIKDENHAEAVFVGYCRKQGAVHQAYTPIMGSGERAGTLHYVANAQPFPDTQPGALILVDAGAEYNCYAADVTRCIPIGNGGRFTKECKEIYELVLEMQMAAFEMVKPGASYEDIQLKMHEVAAKGLLRLGLFKPSSSSSSPSETETIQSILESGLTTAFYPHGVGHLLGLDVHDAGGLPQGKSKHSLMKYLRLRVPLEEGFVVTIEPGVYFNAFLQKDWKNSPFVDWDKVEQYAYVGGVRIEDNLLVTKSGFENLTPSSLPKTVAEIEAVTTSKA
ncbi:BQ5605_C008g05172 [Microbotryum silenes-dioicae]|uniref:BQ5605_C008g05172 protein n=1 Tax=Microbotryum silenes-dioicae TaxID=796604 RepID=A0A2X0MFR7_9BASI|nr:BQ5605_C008g05172 [Microbotryum silenes-dioicae]